MTRFLIMDVDGTLTDGKIYVGIQGELMKCFDAKDGCGIKDILPQYNIIPIIITARNSKILVNRCKELNIVDVYQGIRNKIEKLDEVLREKSLCDGITYNYTDVAYIGDDILDLQCMQPITKAGGLVGCPSNAVQSVQSVADFICKNRGGEGAVREFIEWIIKKKENDKKDGL